MFSEYLAKVNELKSSGKSYAIAVVVRHEKPISGKPGNRAIIMPDGRIYGWIGGGCSQPVVIKEAKKSLEDGEPRLVRITPKPEASSQEGVITYNMTCHSGGTLDIFIEPILTSTKLIIFGRSAVGKSLAKLAKAIDYDVTVVAPGAEDDQFPNLNIQLKKDKLDLTNIAINNDTYIVVSTQGEYDEEALEMALQQSVSYISFVASRKKSEKIFEYLKGNGISDDELSRIRTPAGLDIKAKMPEEIAVSILAEIIMVKRNTKSENKIVENETLKPEEPKEAIDPVCNMTVEIASAKYNSVFKEKTYYFCCIGCKQSFNKEPEKYIVA
ncbi:MAG: XdhC family protein [Candidatus Thorarchaeota archaeon]